MRAPLAVTWFVIFFLCITEAYAGWQITAIEKVSDSPIFQTNLFIIKIETNNIRMDLGSALSTIVMPDHETEVQLYRDSKIYRWIYGGSTNGANGGVPAPIYAGEANYDHSPAKLYCWTNGTEYEHAWVVPANKFVPSGMQLQASKAQSFSGGSLGIGSLYDANSVVAKTEHSNMRAALLPLTAGGSGADLTNIEFTVTDELVSIIQTNFPPSEFEIPGDYKDMASLPLQQQISPDAFGRKAVVSGNMEGLRKGFENGTPVLPNIPYNDK